MLRVNVVQRCQRSALVLRGASWRC